MTDNPLYTVVIERAWHPDHFDGAVEYEVIAHGLSEAEADDLERRANDEIDDRLPVDTDRWWPDYEDTVIVVTDAEAQDAAYRRAV